MGLKLYGVDIEIAGKKILKNINLDIKAGDTVAILGPNGHGKSTLLKAIMNHYDTKITSGEISVNGTITNDLTTDKIAKLGVYLAMQNPVEIPGLGMLDLLRTEASNGNSNISVIELYKILHKKMKDLNMNPELLNRNINENFSGGERKKNEILQLQVLSPEYALLDEIDSGLDIDAINNINKVLLSLKQENKTIVYISHDNKLHTALQPNKVVLIVNGEIVEIGGYELAQKINELGYQVYLQQKNIAFSNDNQDDEFLKSTSKGYNCGGIK